MITIKFYWNGYETFGHSDINVCAQISAMHYVINGIFLELDTDAGCFDGEDGTGYTALHLENKLFFGLFEVCKENLKKWVENEFDKENYKIIEIDDRLEWSEVLEEMDKRGLEFD